MVLLCHLKKEVITTVRRLIIEDDRLREYMDLFDEEVSRGLNKDTCDDATVKSIVTHVNKLPSGQEEGQFLGLDFSGQTIKIMLVKLENRECTITRKMYDIPEKYMVGKSEKLFDFIAKSIANFLGGLKLKMSRIPLGVTFGFPIEQTSLQDCKLLRWSKGFKCDDLIDKNVFKKLKNSIRKFPELKKIFVIGILNDSVSAVLACAWQDPSCMIGAVVGPGVSCCYAEKVSRVTKYEAENYGIRDIYMNLESAQLGEDGCLDKFRTDFDLEMDRGTQNTGKIINDKLISTEYFPQIVRLILLKCLDDGIILNGQIPDSITKEKSIKLEHLQKIESDPDNDHTNCRAVLTELGFEDVTDEDCFQVQFICRCVSRRSANLVAAQLAVIINRINLPSVTIAADGYLIKEYPNYKWYLMKKIGQLKKEGCSFQIIESEENGLGPAVMAAVFGEETMDRDEKLRRLPGFPMDKCHFGKKGKCLNPDCNAKAPCDTSLVNPMTKPMTTTSQDVLPSNCQQDNKEQNGKNRGNGKNEKKCGNAKKEKNCGSGKAEGNGENGVNWKNEENCENVKNGKNDKNEGCGKKCKGYDKL